MLSGIPNVGMLQTARLHSREKSTFPKSGLDLPTVRISLVQSRYDGAPASSGYETTSSLSRDHQRFIYHAARTRGWNMASMPLRPLRPGMGQRSGDRRSASSVADLSLGTIFDPWSIFKSPPGGQLAQTRGMEVLLELCMVHRLALL